MALEDDEMAQGDALIAELERASIPSALDENNWHELGAFLDNFDALSNLPNTKICDIARIVKRKKICFYIAAKPVDKSPETMAQVCNVLPRIEKLIFGELFEASANIHLAYDWLNQVIFLFECISSNGDEAYPQMEPESLAIILKSLNELIELYSSHSKASKNQQLAHYRMRLDTFEKLCCVAKIGASMKFQSHVNLLAVKLMKLIVPLLEEDLLKPTAIVSIGSKLWLIVRNELRSIVIHSFAYCYKINQTGRNAYTLLTRKIMALIRMLPVEDASMIVFLRNTLKSNNLSLEVHAADLSILKSWIRGSGAYQLWPILKIYLKKDEPLLRGLALGVASDLVKSKSLNCEEIKSLLECLKAIAQDVIGDDHEEHSETRTRLIELLLAIEYNPLYRKQRYDVIIELPAIMELIIHEEQKEKTVNLATRSLIEFRDHANFDKSAMSIAIKFTSILRSYDLTGDPRSLNLLRSQFKLLEANAKYMDSALRRENQEMSLISAVISSSSGDGSARCCDEGLRRLLKIVRCFCQSTNATCLLPLARRVFDKEAPCRMEGHLLATIHRSKRALRDEIVAFDAYLAVCHQGWPEWKLCEHFGGYAQNCKHCLFAIEAKNGLILPLDSQEADEKQDVLQSQSVLASTRATRLGTELLGQCTIS